MQNWEQLVHNIVGILHPNVYILYQPTIPTPDIKERKHIRPDLLIIYPDKTTEIIDAKRSLQDINYKDLFVYPRCANRITFYVLEPITSDRMPFDDKIITIFDSNQLIEKLIMSKTELNESKVGIIITKIRNLRGKTSSQFR